MPKIVRQELTSANKVFEGIRGRSGESALPPGSAAACSSAAWEISFMRGRKEAAVDPQLLSIKPFTASIKCLCPGGAGGLLALATLRMEAAK